MSTAFVHSLEVGLVGVALLAVYTALTTPTVVCLLTLTVLYVIYRRERRKAAGTIPLTDKHVLITGCDSGFGLELAQHLHRRGCHVFATVLNPDSPGAKKLRDVSSPKLSVMPLDVSKDDDVSACLRRVKDVCDNTGLWGLVNNAGINFVGDVELTTMSQYLRVADVNLFGMVRCTRAFLPLIRQAKGRIVNVTSIKGLLPAPVNAAYNITKYGGETFSDIVRLEMKEFGVKVVIIEPGNFGGATGCINSEGMLRIKKDFDSMWDAASDDVKQLFKREHLDRVLAETEAAAGTSYPTVEPVLNTIEEALTSGDPEIRYIIDGSNRLMDKYCMLVRVKHFLPERLFDHLVLYFFPYKVDTNF
ncbi:D-beta-hydroxybutyrate dehydrogenase, mitochondrial-like [Pomacea canaliculata]|uniref:D-beta-hydroxybutyrate dehydrogenase, mitochondrial-like n=1 Tax=Pomacea canaliculata TaxID=400727 RepID=UPI000D729F22|nr:D-beta-hydroxybutyrate dehydrogenase, mitochondrial-like [Pomacea canaliculata]XP_025096724.1 D-beta-hydroxybutyrate dehydrogenase, mitochondrial-like [Pomacea canaliculata]XP_025096725.1 D-beta-hydroxybutyrate dehydrogenase, mitochondrial-like [Pomacea canaliculata]XP_025096726.1 D-beta-hydroxybutyrate dehydrogenase, mitochondrial-like [Pomacea canaliculata]